MHLHDLIIQRIIKKNSYTKFERDTFIRESRDATYQSNLTSYEFINASFH